MQDVGQPWQSGTTPGGEVYVSARADDGHGGRIIAMDGAARALDPADAALIASAPDGIEFAEAFLVWCNTDYARIGRDRSCNPEYLRRATRATLAIQARAAIAKARS